MGKFVFFLVALSFAAFALLLFQPGDFLFSGLRLDPHNLLGPSLPEEFEIEQAIQSGEGDILSGIDRRNELRVHLVRARSEDPEAPDETPSHESTAAGNSVTAGSTSALLELSKRYKIGKDKDGSFLTRYLSAQIDPRRAVIQSSHQVTFLNTPAEELAVPISTELIMITSKKHHWYGVIYLKEANLLVLVSHPSEEVQPSTFMQSLTHLGFHLEQE